MEACAHTYIHKHTQSYSVKELRGMETDGKGCPGMVLFAVKLATAVPYSLTPLYTVSVWLPFTDSDKKSTIVMPAT